MAFYGCFDWHSSVHGHWLKTLLPLEAVIVAQIKSWLASFATYLVTD